MYGCCHASIPEPGVLGALSLVAEKVWHSLFPALPFRHNNTTSFSTNLGSRHLWCAHRHHHCMQCIPPLCFSSISLGIHVRVHSHCPMLKRPRLVQTCLGCAIGRIDGGIERGVMAEDRKKGRY